MISRRQFAPFLLKQLESQHSCIKWYDREKKLFYIIWSDNRRNSATKERCPIFKDWEIHNKRYKGKENWSSWKQTFSNALEKCPDIRKVPELCKRVEHNAIMKVFKFGDAVKSKCGKLIYEDKTNKINMVHPFRQEADFHPDLLTIPKVVTEVLRSESCGLNSETYTNCHPNIYQAQTIEYTQNICEQQTINTTQISYKEQRVDSAQNIWQEQRFDPIPYTCQEPANSFGVQPGLDSDELDAYFSRCAARNSSSISSSDIPDCFLSEDDNKSCVKESIELMNPQSELDSKMEVNASECFTNDNKENKPFLRYNLYYFNQLVMQGTMNEWNPGLRLFYGKEWESSCPDFFGPKDYQQVRFPDLSGFPNIFSKNRDKIESILDKMNRGLTLHMDPKQGKVYARRLCSARVFAWNLRTSGMLLERKSKTDQQLFDMNRFKDELSMFKSDPHTLVCPSPSVILTFGQDPIVYANVPERLCVHLKLTIIEAEEMFQREILNDEELLFSGFDSYDELLSKVKSLQVQ